MPSGCRAGDMVGLGITLEKTMPLVKEDHATAVMAYYAKRKNRGKMERRWMVGGSGASSSPSAPSIMPQERSDAKESKVLRYPEVRGLRSKLGENNRIIFVNRDADAAVSIARLAVMMLSAGGKNIRPTVFCRPLHNDSTKKATQKKRSTKSTSI
jgi:hypothetical protein